MSKQVVKTSSFNLNILKGRLAEQIVQDLFQQSGYNVFNFGLERMHPSLSKMLATNNNKSSRVLRYMPDFVVQSSINGDLFYMEVKYRSNGSFQFDESYADYPYQNAWFVIVSPERIQPIHFKRLAEGKHIGPDTAYSLLKVKSFHINPELLREYQDYCKVLFAGFGK